MSAEDAKDAGRVIVSDFSFRFEDQAEGDAPFLQDLNFTIEPGSFVAVIGPSSCGKSTLGLCLTGVHPNILGGSIWGSIHVGGLNTLEAEVADLATKIGIVFQDPDSNFCNLFVDEEVAFGPENLLVDADEIRRRVRTHLDFVDMAGFDKRRNAELSGGQKQRTAIASVLAMESDVIILDQPTANLDPYGKEEIFRTLSKLNRETGKTLILIEHQIDNLIEYVDHLIVMDKGRILFQGPPRQVLREHGVAIEQELGLWLPEATRAGLALEAQGVVLDKIPVNVRELAPVLEANAGLFLNREDLIEDKLSRHAHAADILTVEDVVFCYPAKPNVLKGVSFSIKKGSIAALMGENGCGKSTLSRLMIGLRKPASGRILLSGKDVATLSMKEICAGIGYVFQYPELQFICDNVWEEVGYGLKRFGNTEEENEEIVRRVIGLTHLDGLETRHPLTLSAGEKRRLSIATMLVHRPELLILDEPSAGLDYRNCTHMMEVLAGLNREGMSILMISHTTYLVARYAEHVLVMDEGEMVFDGGPVELFETLDHVRTKAIEKPEFLKSLELAGSALGKKLPGFLVADEIGRVFQREA